MHRLTPSVTKSSWMERLHALQIRLKLNVTFPALWAPVSNYLVLIFIALVLFIMWQQGFKESVIMIPVWIVLMFGLFHLLTKKDNT